MILYSDDHLIVANKPSGLLSVPGRGVDKQDCLSSRIQSGFPDALSVHRLDMETSGLIVMARGKAAHRALSISFERRQVEKRYVAVVAGSVRDESGEIDLPLICDWPNRPRQIVDHARGKPSLTRFRRLEVTAARTRLALYPETGRSHQLRVHLAAIGHPILGDALYADPDAFSAAPRLLLHADWLEFCHPGNGERVEYQCPPPF